MSDFLIMLTVMSDFLISKVLCTCLPVHVRSCNDVVPAPEVPAMLHATATEYMHGRLNCLILSRR